MVPISVQVTYRNGRPVAGYIALGGARRERSVRSREVAPEIVVDFAADGRPLGVEVINPDVTSAEEIYTVFEQLGLTRPSAAELSPLVAA